ncbi:MAG: aromatic-ring-hydroxylating dioxygenase subunit beta [Pseudomonadota bacterium]
MTVITPDEAKAFLYREALLLDEGDYDAWLDLFTPDAVFWMPAWRSESEQTDDPDRELSLIYYQGRRNLEDRVKRIRSGLSVASKVRLRVMHAISNVMVTAQAPGTATVSSCFIVNLVDVRAGRTHAFFGRYEHDLIETGDGWRISRKLIRLLNDVVPTLLDIYSI